LGDPDLRGEETLEYLWELEYQKGAKSVPAAVALSFIPGAGWGLLYAGKPAQSVVPFALSAIGYGMGIAYMAGAFDTESVQTCQHARDNLVPFGECGIADDPTLNKNEDPRADLNERPPPLNTYFNTTSDYDIVTTGANFDGTERGLLIIAGTYVITTIVGAAWAGSAVASHNNQLKKDIESTASMPRPYVGFTGRRGVAGVTLDF
jgi:hypothetical protein